MTITAQRILTELGNRAWSGFNKDDMQWDNEDAQQARTELNFAVRYLINLEDFPFRSKEKSLTTSNNVATYNIPDGQITTIYNVDDFSTLTFLGENSIFDKQEKGKPSGYWVDYKNPKQKLHLYPIPDDSYNYNLVYNQYKPVITDENKTAFEFTKDTDFINMPENLEFLFMDCLVLRTMITNNKDQEDENYGPMINEFNEAWKVFLRASNPVKIKKRIIW